MSCDDLVLEESKVTCQICQNKENVILEWEITTRTRSQAWKYIW